MSQLWSIPPETTDWFLMKVQLYAVAQLQRFLNHSVCPMGGLYVMDFC